MTWSLPTRSRGKASRLAFPRQSRGTRGTHWSSDVSAVLPGDHFQPSSETREEWRASFSWVGGKVARPASDMRGIVGSIPTRLTLEI